jgi:hypothetical protein
MTFRQGGGDGIIRAGRAERALRAGTHAWAGAPRHLPVALERDATICIDFSVTHWVPQSVGPCRFGKLLG